MASLLRLASRPLRHVSRVRTLVSFPRRNGAVPMEGKTKSVKAEVSLLTPEEFVAAQTTWSAEAFETHKAIILSNNDTEGLRIACLVKPSKDSGDVTEDACRSATAMALGQLKKVKATEGSVALGGAAHVHARTIARTAWLNNYQFDKYYTIDDRRPHIVEQLSLVKASDSTPVDGLEEAQALANATVFARDLMMERADVASPEYIHKVAQAVAKDHNMEISAVVGDEQLAAENMNLLRAVGQASRFDSRVVALSYKGGPADEPPIVLVGKGITFDTGGLNLKPTNFIETMHYDMGGSAAVLACMDALGRLGVKKNIVGVLALAENAIGSNAYKPMDIIRSRKGTMVEIGNTDAEGRLALADAMTYAQDTFKPAIMIDVATLTGACVVALGPYAAGLFSNSDDVAAALSQAGTSTFERVWRLPILPEHTEELRGKLCDLSSTGASRYGGACTAAAFLQHFVEPNVSWAHVDIAGPSDYPKAQGDFNAGGTGFGAALLARYVLDQAQKK